MSSGILSLNVAEVENLLCIEEVIKGIASYLKFSEEEVYNKIFNLVKTMLSEELDVQVSNHTISEIRFKLSRSPIKGHSKESITKSIQDNLLSIEGIYEQNRLLYQSALDGGNLNKILAIYNRKSIVRKIAPILGLKEGEYEKLVIRLLKSDCQEAKQIREGLQKYIPCF